MSTPDIHPLPTTNGSTPHDVSVEPTSSFDPSIFRSYLLSLLPPVVGASTSDLQSLFDVEFDERVSRFAADGSDVIYVVKVKDEVEGVSKLSTASLISRFSHPTDDGMPMYTYQLTPHLSYLPSHVTTLALIKRAPTLDPLTPLSTQLHFLNLFAGDETPYESLHAVVSCGVKPWFDAFVGARGGGKDGDTKMGEHTIHFIIPPRIQELPLQEFQQRRKSLRN
jgi:hypothetical protein